MSDKSNTKNLTPVRTAIILMAAGAVLFVGGWVYDVLLAGSPSEDAAQQAAWDYHKTVASYIRFGALGAWGLSVAFFAWASFGQDDTPGEQG